MAGVAHFRWSLVARRSFATCANCYLRMQMRARKSGARAKLAHCALLQCANKGGGNARPTFKSGRATHNGRASFGQVRAAR